MWIVLAIVFLGYFSISMSYLIFPPLFLNAHYAFVPASWGSAAPALLLGVTCAAYPLGQFIGSPILGTLSDKYGRRNLLAGSLILAAFCTFLSGFAIVWHAPLLLILSRFLTGLLEGVIVIGRAMATDIKIIPKHETLGKINAATAIAFLAGPAVGGFMATHTMSTPFYAMGTILLMVSLLSFFILENKKSLSAIQRPSKIFSQKLKILLITSTAITLAVDVFYEFAPVYLTVKWTFTPAGLVPYNVVLCLFLALGNGFFPKFFTLKQKQGIVAASIGFAALLTGIVLVNNSLLMYALFALCGIAIGIAMTLVTVKISDAAPETVQGEVMGIQFSLQVLGNAFICLLGGALLLLSPKIILLLAALLLLSATLYYKTRARA